LFARRGVFYYEQRLTQREKEVKDMPTRQDITLESIYRMVVDLQRDVALIKKTLMEEPELRDDFILRMRDIDLEKAIMVQDFGKTYGLK
jgi:hypothetical protein